MLVISISSFFHNVFKRPYIQGRSKSGKGLTLYQTKNFRLVQIESICNQQNKFFNVTK